MSDDALASRARLPLLLLALALLIGGSKLDTLRPVEGQVVALALPVIAVLSGCVPFRETDAALRNVVFGLGAVVLVLAEYGACGVVIDGTNESLPVVFRAVLMACAFGALLCEVAAAQRGFRSRLTAWLGLAVGFALYFPGHASEKNLFGSVFAAFLVAMFAGGGAGLFIGEYAVRKARG
ncbi:MAG: hypothetical protein ABI488_23820 [Polyangiaceae bacterium]